MQRLVYVCIFLLLISSYGISSTFYQYVFAVIILILLLINVIKKKFMVKLDCLIDFFPILMIFVWVYGVVLGLYSENKTLFVFSNFAGMSLYFVYYALTNFKLDAYALFKVVWFAALVNMFYSLSSLFMTDYGALSGLNVNSYRIYFSTGLIVIAPIISLLIAIYIYGSSSTIIRFHLMNKYVAFFLFILSIITIVVFSASKGFFLVLVAILMVFLVMVMVRLTHRGKGRRGEYKYLFLCSLSVLFLFLLIPDLLNILVLNFSGLEASNKIRNEQTFEIIKELSAFGSGLGGELRSGYIRNESFPYAFEISYLGLVHKVGVFSIVPILIYLYTCILILGRLLKLKDVYFSSLALGAMMFLIPSYGNPVLYSPISVVLHCVALYWLKMGRATTLPMHK